ncbi:actin-related protein 5-like protein [Dinothrombium tinctorium]|uniref:Actin-related protein 5-like protein n=1 Tax=Dinothrombium tinctorium TaxID=1965070 RepID=A0A3S3PR11_9ACAR|nr:actin-related protein 5-like protein [Dinothrombium tinctorium]RWS17512.1 actin-related protein 5-like protein [Dinothrombium tinctorium]RWS17523.1 actin-related protein 5-like protein [Dinothrombium tinctorium]
MSFLPLQEIEATPDPFYAYSPQFDGIPIVIDNGAYNCRVGFANEQKPKLVFRNLIAKLRGKKEPEILVGNDISNLEAVKWLLRSPLEANVVTQFDVQEIVFDHIFSHLGIRESSISHPIVINEPPAIPLWCRSNIFELLFECYRVPSILTGIDALFSYYYNIPDIDTCIVVSFGHHTCHRAFCQIGVKNASELRSKLTELNQEIRTLKAQLDPKQENDDTVIDEIKEWLKQNNDENKWLNFVNELKKSKTGENAWILNELIKEYDMETKRFKRFGGLEDVVEIGPEQIRVTELLFSPYSLIKFEQCGVSEAIEQVINKCGNSRLGENIFITGGCALLRGLKERIESDVRSIRPFQSPLSVNIAENPLLNAWDGARKAAMDFSDKFVSRQEFQDCGHEYIKEHRLSNLWNTNCDF